MKRNAVCKKCRREGKKLFLKGERCYTVKCALVKRKYPPGVHGPKGHSRLSEYGHQLREKQYLKRSYNISETQLKNYFKKAKRHVGNTEILFLQLLESRLDNVIFRSGLAVSRKQARQIVGHGNILVNNRRLDIPSYQVRVGDVLKPRERKSVIEEMKRQISSRKVEETMPSWLNLDQKKLEVKVLKKPEAEDLPKDFNMGLVVEFYGK